MPYCCGARGTHVALFFMSNYVLPEPDKISYLSIDYAMINLCCLGLRMVESNYQWLDCAPSAVNNFGLWSNVSEAPSFILQFERIRCCCMWRLTWSSCWVWRRTAQRGGTSLRAENIKPTKHLKAICTCLREKKKKKLIQVKVWGK